MRLLPAQSRRGPLDESLSTAGLLIFNFPPIIGTREQRGTFVLSLLCTQGMHLGDTGEDSLLWDQDLQNEGDTLKQGHSLCIWLLFIASFKDTKIAGIEILFLKRHK